MPRLIGVEIEFNYMIGSAKSALEEWSYRWEGEGLNGAVHEDGSCGWEAVTPPLDDVDLKNCLKEFSALSEEHPLGCDNRCGLHVHVDCRDLGWPEMYRLLRLYAKVEGFLFVLGGQGRWINSYAFPVGEMFEKATVHTKERKEHIISAVRTDYGATPLAVNAGSKHYLSPRAFTSKKDGGRYKALNIIPWIYGTAQKRKDATVEFRLHKGTHDYKRIYNWAVLCSDMVSFAKKCTNKQIERLPKSPARALGVVSPRSKHYILDRLKIWRKHTKASKETFKGRVPRILSPLGMYSGNPSKKKAAIEKLLISDRPTVPAPPARNTRVSVYRLRPLGDPQGGFEPFYITVTAEFRVSDSAAAPSAAEWERINAHHIPNCGNRQCRECVRIARQTAMHYLADTFRGYIEDWRRTGVADTPRRSSSSSQLYEDEQDTV